MILSCMCYQPNVEEEQDVSSYDVRLSPTFCYLTNMCSVLNTVGGCQSNRPDCCPSPPTDQLLANWVTIKSFWIQIRLFFPSSFICQATYSSITVGHRNIFLSPFSSSVYLHFSCQLEKEAYKEHSDRL